MVLETRSPLVVLQPGRGNRLPGHPRRDHFDRKGHPSRTLEEEKPDPMPPCVQKSISAFLPRGMRSIVVQNCRPPIDEEPASVVGGHKELVVSLSRDVEIAVKNNGPILVPRCLKVPRSHVSATPSFTGLSEAKSGRASHEPSKYLNARPRDAGRCSHGREAMKDHDGGCRFEARSRAGREGLAFHDRGMCHEQRLMIHRRCSRRLRTIEGVVNYRRIGLAAEADTQESSP